MAQSLLKRPLDLFYCAFFLVHAFCATIDAQQFLPASVFPSLLLKINANYQRDSGDPLVSNAHAAGFEWFKTALLMELLVHLPIFLLGTRALYQDRKTWYPILIAYSASGTLSATQCVAALFGAASKTLTSTQMQQLALFYVPFAVIPAYMTVDFTWRTYQLAKRAESKGGKAQ